MGTAGVWIVIGVIVLVLLVFVGLVWLFVRISGPAQPRLPEPQPRQVRAARPQKKRPRAR